MTPLSELSAATIISLVGALFAFAMSWGIVRFQAGQHDKRIARLDERVEALGRELAEFKVEAAKRFVTDEMLLRLEERVVGAIDRLAERLDRVIEARAAPRGRAG